MKQCLVITATLQPNSVLVTQNDVTERRVEYLHTLGYYCSIYKSDIFFIENSEYSFDEDSEFQELFQLEHVHLIKYPVATEVEKGKGYQEFDMLDQWVTRLKNDFEEVVKVTGRYKVKNFDQLVNQKNPGFVIDRHKKRKVAITSFFKFKVEEYNKHIKKAYLDVNDSKGVFIEHVVYDRLKCVDQQKISLFIQNPVYEGISGSYGGSLNRHPLKMKFRNAERKLLMLAGQNEFGIEY